MASPIVTETKIRDFVEKYSDINSVKTLLINFALEYIQKPRSLLSDRDISQLVKKHYIVFLKDEYPDREEDKTFQRSIEVLSRRITLRVIDQLSGIVAFSKEDIWDTEEPKTYWSIFKTNQDKILNLLLRSIEQETLFDVWREHRPDDICDDSTCEVCKGLNE